ncbi:hypothetical protein BDW71DRAFT_215759 [Aspergillus fruticulosus]
MHSLAFALFATAGSVQGYTMVDSGYIMRKNIDSIVQPGRYTSHMHSFFGNDAVTATTSTTQELMSGCATNSNPNDLSVYWHPTLYANNGTDMVPIEARYFKAYYHNMDSAEIAFPTDFKAVAGNASASTAEEVDELWTMSWWCEYGPESTPDINGFPSSGCNLGRLQVQLRFPDCVNTATLDHGYSSRAWLKNTNRCPDGMKRIPQLRFSVRFDHSAVLPDGWSGESPLFLASGNAYSFHGDFINGWIPEAAENMLLATDKRNFQVVEGPNSEMPTCTPTDADPENGTSDYKESLVMQSAAGSGSDPGARGSTSTAVPSPTLSPALSSISVPTEVLATETPAPSVVDTTTSQRATETKTHARPHHRPGKHGRGHCRPRS